MKEYSIKMQSLLTRFEVIEEQLSIIRMECCEGITKDEKRELQEIITSSLSYFIAKL